MTRAQFLNELYRRLGSMSKEQAEQHLTYYAEMLMDRIAACKVYNKDRYTDASPLEYYSKGKENAPMHPRTKKLLEGLLRMLAERGEEETFAYIRKRILRKR